MPSVQREIAERLYGSPDFWSGFEPNPSAVLEGWNGKHPSLDRLVETAGDKIVVDVGVWKGMSSINMALAMKSAGVNGCVIAVDTFLGSPEHWSMGLFDRHYGRPDLYETFLSNVCKAEVCDYIVPLPQTSTTAAHVLDNLGIRPNIVHIDAAHEYLDVKRDADEFWAIIAAGGYLIGDDYDASWSGVIEAAGEFSAKHRLALTIEIPKWIVRKPG